MNYEYDQYWDKCWQEENDSDLCRYLDGVVAHAILDHLTVEDAKNALVELFRITRHDGLVMVSFDVPEEDNFTETHILLEDGTMQYTNRSRNGMLFHPYGRKEIEELTRDYNIV